LAPNGTGSIDVIEIDAASHGGVDDARDLRERAFYAPVRDRFKVYIIDEAHMVTTQGFNALLKLIEEPPEFIVFVFATTEPDKVLQTIRSRTHHYPFRLIPPGVMRAHLERICADEGVNVAPAVLPVVVRAGGGSARDSLSVLDQLLAGAGPEGVTYADAVALLGVTDSTLLDDMVDALAAGDAASVYDTVDRVVEAGHDPRRFAADLLDRFRDLIVLDAVPDAAERGLIDDAADTLQRMSDQATRIGGATLVRNAEIVHTALVEMRGTTSPRLVLELLCARMQLPDAAADSAALLQRIERLERRNSLIQGGPPAPPADEAASPAPRKRAASPRSTPERTPKAAEPTATSPKSAERAETPPAVAAPAEPAPASTTGPVDAAALRRLWPDVLETVKQSSRRTRALLDNAQVATLNADQITLSAPTAPLAKMIGDEANIELLRTALSKVIGGTWRVTVEVAGGAAGDPGRGTEPSEPPVHEPDPRDDSEPVASTQAPASDAEADALSLLQSTLGARPIDDVR
jgi:DNA polymerase-3 subunit gamma/tau